MTYYAIVKWLLLSVAISFGITFVPKALRREEILPGHTVILAVSIAALWVWFQ